MDGSIRLTVASPEIRRFNCANSALRKSFNCDRMFTNQQNHYNRTRDG